ncbi:MAG: hypothetical protein KAS32_31385 [Candidatus Peribacteraceae bacterium]|nr:hypothetical protein [Candidatus Peribacteraceae bacterium]
MRTYKNEERPVRVPDSVICDECGKECKNCNIDIRFRFNFEDNDAHLKDVCYDCFEKRYRPDWIKQKAKELEHLLNLRVD